MKGCSNSSSKKTKKRFHEMLKSPMKTLRNISTHFNIEKPNMIQ